MKVQLVSETGGLRTFAVIMDKGDEAVERLNTFAAREEVSGAGLTAVGACREATLGYFDRQAGDYLDIPVGQQSEVLSLVGDIATHEGRPVLHAHAVLGHRDGSTTGGHLKRLTVWPTLEVLVTETPTRLRKKVDPEVGLALIDLDQGP